MHCTSNEPAGLYAGAQGPALSQCKWPKNGFLRKAIAQLLADVDMDSPTYSNSEEAAGSSGMRFTDQTAASVLGPLC
eukprot:SAG31_NODE_27538_length_424_cov_1.067692_1_plen_76_part_10